VFYNRSRRHSALSYQRTMAYCSPSGILSFRSNVFLGEIL
jgi:hypothetical protein